MKPVDYAVAPQLVIWEVTRACSLACVHCRASAQDQRDPRELTTDEGRDLIDQVAAMGTPLFVFTGGDPLQRDDLEDLIRHARSRGLMAATIPAATARLTKDRVLSLRDAGVHQLALSLDAPTAAAHDAFRQVAGTFDKVVEAAQWIREAGVPLQFNTVIGPWNVADFDALARFVTDQGAVFWEVFFLVPTGRGAEINSLSPAAMEALFPALYEFSLTAPLTVKVTEGQTYRRWFAQHADFEHPRLRRPGHPLIAPRPVNAGNGFLFLDHTGEAFPSGFLPLECGNVRDHPLADIYQHSDTFLRLRDLGQLEGKCRHCPHRDTCSGGSRARAYALTGSLTAPDPLCAYEPPRP